MDKQEIITLIGTQPEWDTKKLLAIIAEGEAECDVTFYHIGGYELLRDGTKEETCNSLKEVQEFLDDVEIEYDETITCGEELAYSVEDKWAERYDDGGGSAWIE